MGRPRLYATSIERKAAWRRRQGMAIRPHYPSAASKQAASRAWKQAAWECAAIQQAFHTRVLADQAWELYELIDACSRDPDIPRRVLADRSPGLLAGGSAHFYGMAAVRVCRHRRGLQRLAQVRATREAQAGAPRDTGTDQAAARVPTSRTGGACREQPQASRVTMQGSRRRGHDDLPKMNNSR
ncbi:MAG TPA: hypothetical protein VI542_22450 [Candidatus Tectomicrobia bacterium]